MGEVITEVTQLTSIELPFLPSACLFSAALRLERGFASGRVEQPGIYSYQVEYV